MPDRHLLDAVPGEAPSHENVQQLVEAEAGQGTQGIIRRWQASDSDRVVLTSDSMGVKISRDNGVTAPTNIVNDGTAAGGALTGTYPSPTFAAAAVDAMIPPGTIWAYGGPAAPAGWLLCDGAAVSRTTYARLFAAVGTLYGPGNGTTTFNLPDLRGRVLMGVSGTHPRGEYGGAEAVSGPGHTHPEAHTHGVSHSHNLGGHNHTVNIDHNHPSLTTGLANQTGTLGVATPAPTISWSRDTHTHDGSVPHIGTTNVAASGPSPGDSGPSTPGSTDSTATGEPAVYTAAITVLQPFGTASFIIRVGA